MAIIQALFVVMCFLIATPVLADWSDLPGIKSREATQKAQDRAGSEVDKKVDKTVNCVFNPLECARKMKRDDPPSPEPAARRRPSDTEISDGPPRPPSATRPKPGPPAPPSARTWYVDVGGGNTREVNETELLSMIDSGEVGRSTPVWTESFGDEFKPAGDVSNLGRHFKGR